VPNTSCTKWVVWRKNAQTLLHPNQMGGNIMVVQCQAARRLLAGETIGPYKWDKNKKLLIQEDHV
jgi:BRCT domain type II-containing protein